MNPRRFPRRARATSAFLTSLFAGLYFLPASANETLKNLPADSWYQAPGTKMRAVCASETEFPTIRGSGGCHNVIDAWGGGAYDAGRKRLWVWGGGHQDYFGNELYAFDMETLKWARITDPSAITADKLSADPLPDGNPISRHTYDGLAFIGPADRLFAFGGSMAGNGYGTSVTWVFDPVAGKWSNRVPSGQANVPATACCNFTAEYDGFTKKVYMRDPNWISAYDFEANAWTHIREWSHSWGPGKAVIDGKRHLLFTLGSEEFLVYDLAKQSDVSAEWKSTGGDSLLAGYGVGAAYDAKTDRLVGWTGGGVYAMDLQTKVWKRMSGAGAPAKPALSGTFGRFRYDAEDNVFALVNGVDEDVWFYKLSAGSNTGLRAPARLAPPQAKVGGPLRAVDGRARRAALSLIRFPRSLSRSLPRN